MSQELSKELTHLVNWAVSELGKVILSELGQEKFNQIEKIRKQVKSVQGQKLAGLLGLKKELSLLSGPERYHIAHSFSLMLELINSCEAAYRTSRLRVELRERSEDPGTYGRVIHVLTAHPTESRSPDIIYYFRKIQKLLVEHLQNPVRQHSQELNGLLKLAWRIPMSKQRKPSVMDEAEYIYSLVLQDDILEIFIKQRERGQPFYIRTWVGGDKDGHPGVNDKTMLGSLQMSRGCLLRWLQKTFENFLADLEPLAHSSGIEKKQFLCIFQQARKIRRSFTVLKEVKSSDSLRVHSLKESLDLLSRSYKNLLQVDSPHLHQIRLLLKVFPGLVVPLELREDSRLVHEALNTRARNFAIVRMLKMLGRISPRHDPRFYVRGFILSQAENASDIIAGMSLVKKQLGETHLPVVPLFESAHSLGNAGAIVEEFMSSPARRRVVAKNWSGKFEVMLGYSDSAKENGAFPSRFLIQTAVESLEKVIASYGFKSIFFHGSGGSIERGGGSVQEQTAWWPASALGTVKVTVQGEMIYRNYTAPEILERQLQRFTAARMVNSSKPVADQVTSDLRRFSDAVQTAYREILEEPHFLDVIELATPYSFLKDLKLGSRPSKRQGPVNLEGLRAIPWVLCWTQTRALFPTWWGVGSFWQSLSEAEKSRYRKAYQESPLFSSYIKVLGFTLEKIELDVFALYLHSSKLPQEVVTFFIEKFKRELGYCKKAVRDLTGEESLLWYRPWLETSIALRSPLIHPLNILQLLALKDKDIPLLRETVTGIASGMLTTG